MIFTHKKAANLWKGVKFEISSAREFFPTGFSFNLRYLENDNPAALVSGGEELSILVELHAGDDISCNKLELNIVSGRRPSTEKTKLIKSEMHKITIYNIAGCSICKYLLRFWICRSLILNFGSSRIRIYLDIFVRYGSH